MMKARKKKKKKLKSRRERNKHKALLKLTHHTSTKHHPLPSHITPSTQPAILSTYTNESNRKYSSLESQSIRIDPSDPTPRNGGIPIFVQERLEERVKRRGDADSACERQSDEVRESCDVFIVLSVYFVNNLYNYVVIPDHMTNHMIQADYVEAVANEYLKQGLPMGVVQEMVHFDPRSSASLLPPPLPSGCCPMSITPMALYEGRVNTRPPSRLSSRTSLPHLGECLHAAW